MSKNGRKYKEILGQMIATIEARLINLKFDAKLANSIAIECVEMIRHTWGGMQLYIPKEYSALSKERDLKIKKEFTGDNQVELSRRYKLSLQKIYTVVRED